MRCEEFKAAYLLGETSAGHLATCAACRAEQPHLDLLRAALAEPILWEEPGEETVDRVVADLTAKVGTRPRPPRLWRAVAAATVVLGVVAWLGVWWTGRPPPPDWEVRLVGTELAPRASGLVQGWETDSGTAIFLRIEGLERAPEDHYYELWFAGERGWVSAGTFWEAPGFELWAAASLEDYPRLGVTLEPDDGNPARSGDQVLGSWAGTWRSSS
jgi:hypothetical protein